MSKSYGFNLQYVNICAVGLQAVVEGIDCVWHVISDDYLGTGNSFHGAGGRDNKKAQMRYCLRLIRSMVSSGEEQVLQDFTDQGAINQLICEYPHNYFILVLYNICLSRAEHLGKICLTLPTLPTISLTLNELVKNQRVKTDGSN